ESLTGDKGVSGVVPLLAGIISVARTELLVGTVVLPGETVEGPVGAPSEGTSVGNSVEGVTPPKNHDNAAEW
ncbi:hypothetical protein Tco_0614176, partial [Tanacetum coccineum]